MFPRMALSVQTIRSVDYAALACQKLALRRDCASTSTSSWGLLSTFQK